MVDTGATSPLSEGEGALLTPPLTLHNRLNSFLDHVDVGEYVVCGDLEAYSCKPVTKCYVTAPASRPHSIKLTRRISRQVN